MYRVLRNIYCGISGKIDENSGKYKFKIDWDDNSDEDIIKFLEPYYFESRIDGNVYWFGYKFTNKATGKYRDDFIEYLKNVQCEYDSDDEWAETKYTDESITESELEGMIVRSLNRIDIFNKDIDTVVYPVSYSNHLVEVIADKISQYLRPEGYLDYVRLKKSNPQKINFDWNRIKDDISRGSLPKYMTEEYILNIEGEIHNLDNFSLRKDIPMRLRKYIQNYMDISEISGDLEGSNRILILDDFKTKGTTIREMINIIRRYNRICEIYIFTLIGKR